MMAVSCVANTFLLYSFTEKNLITPTELQRLLYICFKEYLLRYNEPLFPERFVPGTNGPELLSITEAFQSDGNTREITRFIKNSTGGASIIMQTSTAGVLVQAIWQHYKNHTEELEKASRMNCAWAWAILNKRRFLEEEIICQEEGMAGLF